MQGVILVWCEVTTKPSAWF